MERPPRSAWQRAFAAVIEEAHREEAEDMWGAEFKMQWSPTAEMFGNFPLSTAAESEPQDEVKPEELVRWFVEHGWRSSWQDVVARFLKTYRVVRRGQ